MFSFSLHNDWQVSPNFIKFNTRKLKTDTNALKVDYVEKYSKKGIRSMLSVTDGHRPFQIIFKPGFQLSALVVRLRKVTVISV